MKKFTLLLIDDIEENLYSLKLLIEDSFSYVEILTAINAKDAIMLLMKHDIDLVLSDVQMPEINGFELVEYLRSVEYTKDIPVVLITGIHDSKENVQKGYDCGAIDYLTKPIDDELLNAKLRVYMDIYRQRQNEKDFKSCEFYAQEKATAMVENLNNFSNDAKERLNLEAYQGLLSNDDNYLDFSNIIDLDEKKEQ